MSITQEQIENAADALRRFEQKGKRLNNFDSLPRATKKKWCQKVLIVLDGLDVTSPSPTANIRGTTDDH